MICWLNWHWWEKDPFHKEPVRITGPHILFFSFAEQYGTRRCIICDKEQKVYRTGIMGAGGSAGEWREAK